MSSGADLFVVCKQCGSEVSPYVTECPYCGNRLRRRAPKLPKPGERAPAEPESRGLGGLLARAGSSSKRTAPRRTHRAAPVASRWFGRRPYATIALVFAACAVYIAANAEPALYGKLPIVGPLGGSGWKLLTWQFVYSPVRAGVYALVAITATGLFGWLVEQRHGPAAVLAVFFAAGATGALAALAVYSFPVLSGANAGALGLLAAWAVPDLKARRANAHWEGDLLGVGALAALLLAIPWATEGASWFAGVIGAAVGLLAGEAFASLGAGFVE